MVEGKLGPYSRSVSIVGVGATPFMNTNEDPELLGLTEGDCFGYAALAAMEDAGVEPRDVQYFYHGSANPKFFNDAVTPNMQVAEWFGMRGRGSTHHSEACCTGYVALEQAVMAVASGAYDVVLTGGVDMARVCLMGRSRHVSAAKLRQRTSGPISTPSSTAPTRAPWAAATSARMTGSTCTARNLA